MIAYFGNHGLVALDPDGKVQWEKRLPHPRYGSASAPLRSCFEGLLVLARDGAPEAGILVLDPTDGSELWRIDRSEFGESHGTPFLWRNAEREELVIGGSGRLCSYDPGTGEKLWTVAGLTSFPCTTPTADRDTLYYAAWSTPSSKGRSFWDFVFAHSLELTDAEIADPALLFERLEANADGKVPPDELPVHRAKDAFELLDGNLTGSWELDEVLHAESSWNATGENIMVAVARGAVGDLEGEGALELEARSAVRLVAAALSRPRLALPEWRARLRDAKTGAPLIDRERLSDRSEHYLSPVGAAGHVLAGSAGGTLYLLAADAKELVVEREVTFEEGLDGTPAVLGGVVYLRTRTTLWAFGEPRKP